MTAQPSLLEWEAPAARRSDPETCHMAAASAALRASHGRIMALRHLMVRPPTDFELAAESGVQQTSIGKRRGECAKHGLVEVCTDADGKKITRPSPTNSPALVWQITETGRAFFREQFHG